MPKSADGANGSSAHYATRLVLDPHLPNSEILLDKINSAILPKLTSQDGVRRVYVLQDKGTRGYVVFALWSDKEKRREVRPFKGLRG